MRLKKSWTTPAIRRLDTDSPDKLTPEQRRAVELLKKKVREAVSADDGRTRDD